MILGSLGWLLQPTDVSDFSSQIIKHYSRVRNKPIGVTVVKRVHGREFMLGFGLCVDLLSMES